jgi:hypothetical protein
MERSHDAAFDQRPEAFDCICMDCTHDMLSRFVIDNTMGIIVFQHVVGRKAVGAKKADFAGNRRTDKLFDDCATYFGNDTGNNIALAFYGADDRSFAASATAAPMRFLM